MFINTDRCTRCLIVHENKNDIILNPIQYENRNANTIQQIDRYNTIQHNDTREYYKYNTPQQIDRCNDTREYRVRYYNELGDGFSTNVTPMKMRDKIAWAFYYLTA